MNIKNLMSRAQVTRISDDPENLKQIDDLKRIQGKYSPVSILLITIIGIALAESIAMIVVYFYRHLPYPKQILLDAAVMTVIIFPILYLLSFRPLLLHIEQRYQVDRIIQSRLRIIQYGNEHTLDDLLRFILDEIESVSSSTISYFHFLSADQTTIIHNSWSTKTVEQMCSVGEPIDSHYSVDQAGIWADCIRQKRYVIHNDYKSQPYRKDLPEGHPDLIRDLAVPIIRNKKVVAVFGVGNKPNNYLESDVDLVATLADFAWDIIKRRQDGDALRDSEVKFRTLMDWTYDWEIWMDPEGRILYSSPSCEQISGYTSDEFINSPELLMQIVHKSDREGYMEHHQVVHDESVGVKKVEFRILTRDGEEHWLEHICRPVFGDDGIYLGRRVSNRDITQRKHTENEIEDRNQKEIMLTKTIHTMQLDIARDLHDTIGQNIGYLRMKLDYLSGRSSVKKAELLSELKIMTKAANESYDLIRGTLAVLQSTDSSNLFRIFSRYAEQIQERSNMQVDFSTVGDPKALSSKRMRQLFYIFRESLTNVEKHADADRVTIQIGWNQDHLTLEVFDNGKGFDPLNIQYGSHYGLRFMRERAELLNGSLEVTSTIGSGTTVLVKIPYE